jgi:Xaa-Pro aminopeptidase
MAVIGALDDRQERMAGAIAAGAEAAHGAIRPGARPDDVVETVLAAIRGSGIPDFPGSNAWGHGIGLGLNEAPRVRPGSPTLLEPGMVLCFETPYFELGWGGLQAEDTYLVTEDGCDLLTHAPRTIWLLGGDRS